MFRVIEEAIDPRSLERWVRPGDGAVVTFLGIVRNHADDGRAVLGLSYEAFEPMACAEFEAIAREARERYGDVRLSIVHRTGELAAGDIAVAVLAAARHRGAALGACSFAIEELKRRAPIWKKERYVDGASQWKANAADE